MLIYASPTIALMGSVFFAVHPIHTEAVTYISGRGELLMSFFLLSGTLLFLQSGKRRSWPLYAASLPFFFFSLLAKETAAIFPLWLLVADLTATQPSVPSRLLARQIGPLLVLGLYLVLRQYFVGTTRSDLASLPPDFVHHILLVLKAVSLYTFLILFPLNLHFLHPLDPSFSPTDLQFLFSILLLGGAGWGLRRALDSGKREIVFALLWFLVGLLPLVYFTAWRFPLLEGWLYLPSLGFFLLVALALNRLQRWSQWRLHIWTALFIVVLLGAGTFNRNWDWKDEFEISRRTVAGSPDDPVAVQLMGDAYMRRGKTLDAEKMFQKGLLLAPDDPSIHASLEWFFRWMGKDSEALIHYQKIIELAPKEPYPYWLLGRYYRGLGQFSEAEKYFSEAVRLFPYSSELRNNLAYMYFQQGKYDVAESELRAALKILPYSPVLRSNLDEVLRKKK